MPQPVLVMRAAVMTPDDAAKFADPVEPRPHGNEIWLSVSAFHAAAPTRIIAQRESCPCNTH